jgi:hypothetical protein
MRLRNRTALVVLLWGTVMSAPQVQACATCFGASDDPMARGMNMGIFALLGVIGMVLAGVASFFVFLWYRASRVAAVDETVFAGRREERDGKAWEWPAAIRR